MGYAKRTQGKSIIFIHHAGKDGEQSGTAKQEDILDTVISLKKQEDAEASHGAKFEIHFEKARHLSEAPSILVHLNSETNQWNVTNISQPRKSKYWRCISLQSKHLRLLRSYV